MTTAPPRPLAARPHSKRRTLPLLGVLLCLAVLLGGCGSPAPRKAESVPLGSSARYFTLPEQQHAQEMVVYALGLLGTGYRFGGRNPEAGLDCSGMVSYIVQEISGQRLPHNAAQIASMTRPIKVSELRPGDLVFFNTLNRKHSHMGIYMGDGRFIHAPSSRGQIRVEKLDNTYFRPRIDGARRLVSG